MGGPGGGLAGITLGFLAAQAIAATTPLPARLEPWSVTLGIGITAAVGFARRARTDRSTLTLALAAACVLNAFARLNYFLYPSLYTDIVHTGDILRLGHAAFVVKCRPLHCFASFLPRTHFHRYVVF